MTLLTVKANAAVRVWEAQEITLRAEDQHAHPYTDVSCWVDLKGPGFAKRIYAFWDGGDIWRVRVVAAATGTWSWTSGCDPATDRGLNGRTGSFTAQNWTKPELEQNPNRRGFLRATANGHALQYADGTTFFLVGDTWLAGATARLPFTNKEPDPDYFEPPPGTTPGVTFEEAVAYRKRQGFNSVSMIAAFPTWATDSYASTYHDRRGVFYRRAWEASGITLPDGQPTARAMTDERGYRPFEILPNREGLPDFDGIIPQYFQSIDKKIKYLNDHGFIAVLETTRRDNTPPWKAYFNFDESYSRFVQYLVSRYGAYNVIFSKIHLDAANSYCLTPDDYNEALKYHLTKYGPAPFGQPVTALIDHSTYTTFGHGEKAPWITLHSVGNWPRDNSMYPAIETLFRLSSPYPAINLEPYYAGWEKYQVIFVGEHALPNSDRDNYFARAMMYGSVLSGALAGHVYGTGAYDMATNDEPRGESPYFSDALKYASGSQMQWMKKFVLSEGSRFQDLLLATADISPRKAPGSSARGLDGWIFMMRTQEKDLGFLYFESKAARAILANWRPTATYGVSWYNTLNGEWSPPITVASDANGNIRMPPFPDSGETTDRDWAAKILVINAQ